MKGLFILLFYIKITLLQKKKKITKNISLKNDAKQIDGSRRDKNIASDFSFKLCYSGSKHGGYCDKKSNVQYKD